MRPVFRVNDAQQYKANRKHACGIAEYKNGALKPALIIHKAAERKHNEEHAEPAAKDADQQRARILNNHGHIDLRHPEKYQIIRCRTGNPAGHIPVNIVIYPALTEHQEKKQGKNIGNGKIRDPT